MDIETLPLPGLALTALLAGGLLYLGSLPRSRSRLTTEEIAWAVAALYIYPIKSCRGISLRTSEVVATGLKHDRQFTFAVREEGDEGEWKFITQRQHPLLSQVSTAIDGDVLSASWPAGWWGRKGFGVPLSEPSEEQGEMLQVRVWTDVVSAWRAPADVRRLGALKKFLGIPASTELILCRVRQKREVFRCAPRKEELGWQVVTGFADSVGTPFPSPQRRPLTEWEWNKYPLHLLSLSSVSHLGSRPAIASALGRDLSPQRFRANIIIRGPPAFDEDDWKRFSLGGFDYTAACRTARCKMPNVDPDTGVKHPVEPDCTMRKYRNIDAGARNNACLGMQVVCEQMEGTTVNVGDCLEVLERGEHFFINR